ERAPSKPMANGRAATERLSTERAIEQTTALRTPKIPSQKPTVSTPTSTRFAAALAKRVEAESPESLDADQLPPVVRPADIVTQRLQGTRGTASTPGAMASQEQPSDNSPSGGFKTSGTFKTSP